MNHRAHSSLPSIRLIFCWAVAAWMSCHFHVRAGGVTLVTHGFNGVIDGWVIGMADKMPGHPGFPGTQFTCYQIEVTRNAQNQFVTSASYLAGADPLTSDSGEIFVKLDWSSLSTTFGVSTADIAAAAAAALQATNLIPALQGHALCELPLHLIGHSRGASVVLETARHLGAQGIWVDQVTTLDPRPVGLYGDSSVKNYQNILFTDNYWQDHGNGLTVPNGQAVGGAYNRYLTAAQVSGGYSSSHSDAHLWYHGTVDLAVPTTDTEANLTAVERAAWWTPAEQSGTNAGFHYSLLGGGNRLSAAEPAGAGTGMIRNGYNQVWDLGAGVSANRDALPANNGSWPNLILLKAASTNTVQIGDALPLNFSYQLGADTSAIGEVTFYLDPDTNPFNGNDVPLAQTPLPGTGPATVISSNASIAFTPANSVPGRYHLFARLESGNRARLLYLPEAVTVLPGSQPPLLTAPGFEEGTFRLTAVGESGQSVVLQATTDWTNWVDLATNTLVDGSFEFLDPDAGTHPQRYYRVLLRVTP